MPYLSPAYLAKQAASVDVLSGGRLDLALGLGWMPEEFAAASAVMAGRAVGGWRRGLSEAAVRAVPPGCQRRRAYWPT